MSTQPATETVPADPTEESQPAPPSDRRWLPWLGLLLPLLAIGVFVAADVLRPPPQPASIGSVAPHFELPDTLGGTESLEQALTDGPDGALLYFSMGVGCGGCFAQVPEIDGPLAERGVRLVSIVVDDPEIARIEAERYGATTPIAIDRDRTVSEAYGMLGAYGHGDRPSHSFAFVAPDGTVAEVQHYAEMFVPLEQLLVDLALTG